jgi:hypothetical protein
MSEPKIETGTTGQDRSYWTSRPYASTIISSLKHADLIVLPQEGFRDRPGPVFPVGTEELFRYLKDGLPVGTVLEIAVDEDKYVELALHSDLLVLGSFLVTSVIGPLLANLISDYVNRRQIASQRRTDVKIDIRIEVPGRTDSITYEGPSENLGRVIGGYIKKLSPPDTPALGQPQEGNSDDCK